MWVFMLAEEPRSLHLALSGLLIIGVLALVRRDWRERLMGMIARGAESDPPRAALAQPSVPPVAKSTPQRDDRAKILAMHKKQRRKQKGRGRKAA